MTLKVQCRGSKVIYKQLVIGPMSSVSVIQGSVEREETLLKIQSGKINTK